MHNEFLTPEEVRAMIERTWCATLPATPAKPISFVRASRMIRAPSGLPPKAVAPQRLAA
jgi:hypothetical protein